MTRHHTIRGLLRACEISPPDFAKPGRLTKSQRDGLKFEREVWQGVGPPARRGVWFKFEDKEGLGCCSPDIIVDLGAIGLVLECKLTERMSARQQLSRLYLPVLEWVYGKQFVGVVVVKNVTPLTDPATLCTDLRAAVALARTCIPTLHVDRPALAHATGTLRLP